MRTGVEGGEVHAACVLVENLKRGGGGSSAAMRQDNVGQHTSPIMLRVAGASTLSTNRRPPMCRLS